MKKFAFSLERMLNFQSQNLEKEMGILGRMTAERDALEAQKRDMADKAAGVQADITRREAEGTTIFMLKACFSILESARNPVSYTHLNTDHFRVDQGAFRCEGRLRSGCGYGLCDD